MGFDPKYADLPGAVVGPAAPFEQICLGSFTLADVPELQFLQPEGTRSERREQAKAAARLELERRKAIEASNTQELLLHLAAEGFPVPTLQHRFHPIRRWRFDLCWIHEKAAIDLQGMGTHTRPSGLTIDAEKISAATACGWAFFAATHRQARDGTLLKWLTHWWDADPKRTTFRRANMKCAPVS